jgi:predicted  nucleic acid-binding Zn-ribbon protein
MKNKTFQLKLSHLIIGGIILLLVIFLVKYTPTQDIPNNYDKQKREIDSLGNIINGLKEDQIKLNESLTAQYDKVDSLNKEITTTEKELTQTRVYYGNKIKNITSSSPAELNEFFTERY